MIYNNIPELLNSRKTVEEIVHYDFKYESGKFNNDSVALWFEYRNDNLPWDCDGSGRNSNVTCKLARNLYKILWLWESEKDGRYKNAGYFENKEMGPESMNSYFKVLTQMIDIIKPEGKKQYFQTIARKKWWSNADTKNEGFFNLVKEVLEHDEIGTLLIEYAKLTHTIGNFVLVPSGFNTGRVSKTDDYWDLSLMLLESEEKWMLKKLLPKYINTFFLWDYVDGEGKITPFFATHSFAKKQPSTIYEALELLQKITKAITRRGYFMVAMLKIAHESPSKYAQIMEKVSTDAHLTMVDAIKIVKYVTNDNEEICEILNQIHHEKIEI